MNEKKAKKLRQLARHFQNKGLVGKDGWEIYIDNPIVRNLTTGEITRPTEIGFQRKLHPDCGKAVYRALKKNAGNSSTSTV